MGACCSKLLELLGRGDRRSGYSTIPDHNDNEEAKERLWKEKRPSNHIDLGSVTASKPAKVQVPVVTSTSSHSQAIEIIKPQPIVAVNSSLPKSGFFIEYELKEEIGVGSTSKCYRCARKSDGAEFACKVIDKRQVEAKFNGLLDQFFVEIKVLKSLNHPSIIHLEDTFETPDRIYIVMEMMKGGELFDYVVEKGTLSEEEASVIIRKITSAIAHMHGLNIIHRDLKPENLLLTSKGTDAEVKLIDFGLAKEMSDPVARSFLGTRGYLAPEMLQRHSYDKAIDIWALGVIAFVLLCGCLPFDDDSSRIASDSAARKKFTLRFPRWAASLSTSAKDLLHNLLDVNPKTRFTAEQALNHPWVSGRTVQMNNYLQSPSMIGERRKELRSPALSLGPRTGPGAVPASGAVGRGTLDAIVEENNAATRKSTQGNYSQNREFANAVAAARVRKNSI